MLRRVTIVDPARDRRGDVTLRFDDNARIEELLDTIQRVEEPVFVDGLAVPLGSSLAAAAADGAALSIGQGVNRALTNEHRETLELRLIGGPCRGVRFTIGEGTTRIGREPDLDVQFVIPDPAVSRLHCQITVSDGKCVVSDLGSSFGTAVEGEPCSGPTPVDVGDAFKIGATVVEVARRTPPDAVLAANGDGTWTHSRTFPPTSEPLDLKVRFPGPLDEVDDSQSQWSGVGLMVAMPLAMLAGSFVVGGPSRLATFIPMVLGAGAVAVYGGVSKGRRHKRKRARQEAKHQADVEGAIAEVAELGRAERRRLRADGFDATRAVSTALGPRRELWQRRPGGERFLSVRVGLATKASALKIENPPHQSSTVAWMVPVEVDLTATGGLSLVGDRSDSDGSP